MLEIIPRYDVTLKDASTSAIKHMDICKILKKGTKEQNSRLFECKDASGESVRGSTQRNRWTPGKSRDPKSTTEASLQDQT